MRRACAIRGRSISRNQRVRRGEQLRRSSFGTESDARQRRGGARSREEPCLAHRMRWSTRVCWWGLLTDLSYERIQQPQSGAQRRLHGCRVSRVRSGESSAFYRDPWQGGLRQIWIEWIRGVPLQSSSELPLHWWGVKPTLPRIHELDQHPGPHGAS